MNIRVATPRDLGAVARCDRLAFAPPGQPPMDRLVAPDGELASRIREGAVYVCVDSGHVLGYILFSQIADHVFIEAVATLPQFQGRGIGSRLLAFAERQAATIGVGSVKLFTDGKLTDNLRFYKRRGYVETDRCDDDDFCRVFFSKAIASGRRSAAASAA